MAIINVTKYKICIIMINIVIFSACICSFVHGFCDLDSAQKGEQILSTPRANTINGFYAPSIEICRDYCIRSENQCKSFSFGCSSEKKNNCMLFDKSYDQLDETNNEGGIFERCLFENMLSDSIPALELLTCPKGN